MADQAQSEPSTGPARSDALSGTALQAIQELGSDLSTGLAPPEVEKRRARFGLNRVPDQKPRWILVFLKKFWGLSAWMIELIIVLSAILHRAAELWVSAGLLVLNGVVGFFQDRRASRAVEVLKSRLQVNARVLRARTWSVLPAQELVPGDIIRLRAGDFIPADAKIAEGKLGVDQSTLTGESAESAKPLDAVLYSGSIVKRGEATAVVLLTGVRTFYGRTTELVERARPRLHLEEVVSKVVRWLFVIVGSLVGLAVGLSLWRGIPLLEILPLALVLLLSAVPVALPVMFTVSMAVGALELAKKGVLITRLSAAEDAAEMDVLCIDKTGTITMNRLEVTGTIPLNGFSEAEVIRLGAWASREANQDPIDLAFLASARTRGILDADAIQTSYTPFAPETKRTEAVVESRGKQVTVMKGALRTVAQACGVDLSELSSLEGRAVEQAKRGSRVLAVGASSRTDRLELAGLVMLSDPPRPDSRDMIRAVQGLGVSVKMLTGDALPVAEEMASVVGLGELRRVGEFQSEMKESPERGAAFVDRCGGLAEVLPEDKYLVVKGLQSAKHVTGMTGDGVNDAPALRQAEVGVAVSSATDVAKASASVVLTTEGLSGLLDMIRNGRIIHQRILTWVVNKISRTILKSVLVTGVYLVTGKFVISALGMMLLVFMTDFVKITLATDRAIPSPRPDTWSLGPWVRLAGILGILLVAESLALLAVGWQGFGLGADPGKLGTFTFFMFLSFALCSILSIRERGAFWKSKPSALLLGALVLDGAIGWGISAVGVPGLPAIGWGPPLAILAYALVFALLLNDLVKVRLIQIFRLS